MFFIHDAKILKTFESRLFLNIKNFNFLFFLPDDLLSEVSLLP